MKRYLIWFVITLLMPSLVWGATYYLRADGTVTAANKANAVSCSSADSAMNITQHNAATFSAGDVINLCDDGGVYRDTLTPPSSGSDGSPIVYQSAPTNTAKAEIRGSDYVQNASWSAYESGLGSTWQATLATEPLMVFQSGVYREKGSSKDALNDHEWIHDTGVLYFRDDSGQPTDNTIEAAQRTRCIYNNNQSYIDYHDLILRHDNSGTSTAALQNANTVDSVRLYDVEFRDVAQAQYLRGTNLLFDGCIIDGVYGSAARAIRYEGNASSTGTYQKCIVKNVRGKGFSIYQATTVNIYYSLISGTVQEGVYNTGTGTINLQNDIITGIGLGADYYAINSTAGTVNLSYSNVGIEASTARKWTNGVTPGSGNVYGAPKIYSPAREGLFSVVIDDCGETQRSSYVKEIGDIFRSVLSGSGVTAAVYHTDELSSPEIAGLQAMINAGDEIANHGRDSTALAGASEEVLTAELDSAKADLEAVLTESDGITPYTVKTEIWPQGSNDAAAIAAAKAAGFIGARTASATTSNRLDNLSLYQVSGGYGEAYAGMVQRLNLENNLTDDSGLSNTPSASGTGFVNNQTTAVRTLFYGATFPGTAYISRASITGHDYTWGDWSIGAYVQPIALDDNAATQYTVFFHGTDADNYMKLYITGDGAAHFSVVASGSETIALASAAGTFAVGTPKSLTVRQGFGRIELRTGTGLYADTVNASLTTTLTPANYTDICMWGAAWNYGGSAAENYLNAYVDDLFIACKTINAVYGQLDAMTALGGIVCWMGHYRVPFDVYKIAADTIATYPGKVKVMPFGAALTYAKTKGETTSDGLYLRWIQTDGANHRLKKGSPCIRAGSGIAGITEDIRGRTVPETGAVDIGPYKFDAYKYDPILAD